MSLDTESIRVYLAETMTPQGGWKKEVLALCDSLDEAVKLLKEARVDAEPGLDPKFLRDRIDSFLGSR